MTTRPRDLVTLINVINDSTAPYVLRTDREHMRHRQRARVARSFLDRKYREGRDYRELSNGMLWPITN